MTAPAHLIGLPLWLDLLAAALVVIGAGFALIGSWGLAKLSDFYKRLHGPSKATTLGVGCLLVASVLVFAAMGSWSLHELLITLFLFLTAPVSAHMLIKAALAQEAGDPAPAGQGPGVGGPAFSLPGAPPVVDRESPPPPRSRRAASPD